MGCCADIVVLCVQGTKKLLKKNNIFIVEKMNTGSCDFPKFYNDGFVLMNSISGISYEIFTRDSIKYDETKFLGAYDLCDITDDYKYVKFNESYLKDFISLLNEFLEISVQNQIVVLFRAQASKYSETIKGDINIQSFSNKLITNKIKYNFPYVIKR